MRGERIDCPSLRQHAHGSSPHARGTRRGASDGSCTRRIIPACAGNARAPLPAWRRGADHPRMRGERGAEVRHSVTISGSSPHARGTRGNLGPQRLGVRIIPACAGNAVNRVPSIRGRSDHPRMRGERCAWRHMWRSGGGSSPHARGTRCRRRAPLPPARIIPACAGNARCLPPSPPPTSDHPRMRGERSITTPNRATRAGSSPHARGTRNRRLRRGADLRIIPACAGNAAHAHSRR